MILITVDTLRADRLGYMGYAAASTPNIDALAADGSVFTQAITTMPRTTPAVASLMTGLWPHHHGSREVGAPMRALPTIAQALSQRGYRTLAVSANGVAGPNQGVDAGFDRFITRAEIRRHLGWRLTSGFESPPDTVGYAEATTEAAVRLLNQVDADQSLFLWVLYFDPHMPYWTRHSDAESAPRCLDLYALWPTDRGALMSDVDGVASAALPECSRLYDEEIAYTDAAIGDLLAALDASGRLDDAIVLFTADHGENLGEGGLFFEHGDNAHDAAIRVPLVVRGPGIAPGVEHGGAVSLVDVAPTALALAGVPAADRPTVDGQNLAPILRGEAAQHSERVVFAESATPMWAGAVQHLTSGTTKTRACLNGPRFSLCTTRHRQTARFALFDHANDPLLLTDLAAAHPAVVENLSRAWERWPPGSARYWVARTATHKLVLSPRLGGGHTRSLYDVVADATETVDASEANPEAAARLRAAIDLWSRDLAAPLEPDLDPAVVRSLRALGYIR
jgi:arylsulfatase A-like enzyme